MDNEKQVFVELGGTHHAFSPGVFQTRRRSSLFPFFLGPERIIVVTKAAFRSRSVRNFFSFEDGEQSCRQEQANRYAPYHQIRQESKGRKEPNTPYSSTIE